MTTAEAIEIDEDWEEWDGSFPFVHHMVAGSCAGLMEHFALFPVDTIKTHLQAHSSSGSAAKLRIKELFRERGFVGLWRGCSTMFVGCIPAHAAYFSVYEKVKTMTGADQPGHHPIGAALAGSTASVAHDSILTPMDVCKQRMQLGQHTSVSQCIRHVYRTEGAGAFLRSLPTTVAMNIPYAASLVASNEALKTILSTDDSAPGLGVFLLSGAGAGAVAAIFTNPMDVVKTRLQIGPSLDHKFGTPGFKWVVKQIVREEGKRGFMKGVGPRVALHTPAAAISWTTYEFVKKLIEDA
eukprot:TRINITY_DN10103_c0_g1_i1.p1 TRINITY_DN10103_c0_g1~~TRINITY_DN10103_c0_g1_i1.p1  ORF type:complete len:296 (-),score=63.02 TRINITY_DN10103_c0_g1_i1:219-1106(-)